MNVEVAAGAPGQVERAPMASVRSARAIAVLFLVSGAPALIYQLVWQRTLFRVFGVNIEAVTIVVTAFMLGLGLGSLAGGWLSSRSRWPLLPILAAVEVGTALFGLVSLDLLEGVGRAVVGLPLPVTAAATLALVLVPTLLMGATLPLLVGHLAPRLSNTGEAVGRLYFVNTLGAGAACFIAAIGLFPFLGMRGSVLVAAILNLLVAAAAIALHVRSGRTPEPAAQRSVTRAQARPSSAPAFTGLLALAAAGGFVSLSYEIFFVRIVGFASGGSAASFAFTLGAFLLGLASGSREAGQACASGSPTRAGRWVVGALLAGSAAGALTLPALGATAIVPSLAVAAPLLAVFIVARAWGMLLPYLAHRGVAADDRAGARTSYLYLANILGSAAGGIVTGFVLMDRLGLVAVGQVLALCGIAAACGLHATVGRRDGTGRLRFAAAVATIVAAVGAMPTLSPRLLERLQFRDDARAAEAFTAVIENRSGIVAADASGTVWGNGMYDGRFNTDLAHDVNGIVRPYALGLFHPSPKRVLMIGFASGSWAKVLAGHPAVESLKIVELNPAYLALARGRPEVGSVLDDPKVEIVVDDGRRWLGLHPDERFDAIVQNTTWHFRGNVTNLLSVEYLQLARRHLAPGGVFFYNTTSSDRAQRTACLTMPHGLRFANHMLVSNDPIRPNFERWRAVLAAYRLDGRPVVGSDEAGRILLHKLGSLADDLGSQAAGDTKARALETCAAIERRTAGLALVTDDNMGTEWRYWLGLE